MGAARGRFDYGAQVTPDSHVIVHTYPDGKVRVTVLSKRLFRQMQGKGSLAHAAEINGWPLDKLPEIAAYLMEVQPQRWVENGMPLEKAKRYIMHWLNGGASERTVWDLVAAKDAATKG